MANWKKAAKVLGTVGAIGGVCGAASGLIKWFKPEARDLPSEFSDQIKETVTQVMEAEKKKQQS